MDFKEYVDFANENKACLLATADGDQPRVRPFGTALIFENKLYIQTGKVKDVSKQMAKNPKIEICAFTEGKWVRIEAIAVDDDRMEPREKMLDAYPNLKNVYKADDGNCQVLYLKNATATFYSFGGEPRSVKF